VLLRGGLRDGKRAKIPEKSGIKIAKGQKMTNGTEKMTDVLPQTGEGRTKNVN